jgi:hypothetical protein
MKRGYQMKKNLLKKVIAVLTLLAMTMINVPLTAWAVEAPPAPVLNIIYPYMPLIQEKINPA